MMKDYLVGMRLVSAVVKWVVGLAVGVVEVKSGRKVWLCEAGDGGDG